MAIERALTTLKEDYSYTPLPEAMRAICEIKKRVGDIFSNRRILDPCCGGSKKRLPTYPSALQQLSAKGVLSLGQVHTLDIREDSRAFRKVDYLQTHDCAGVYDLIIAHPPWPLSEVFIRKAMTDVAANGHVVMLLKASMLESKKRRALWERYPPTAIFLHSVRMSFVESRARDSVMSIHVVWNKTPTGEDTRFYLI